MAERVYITEDDDSIRELVTVALSAYSYEVESFVSAEDCLAATEKQVPDIYLFDIMLPPRFNKRRSFLRKSALKSAAQMCFGYFNE